jgi:hypothetical protein
MYHVMFYTYSVTHQIKQRRNVPAVVALGFKTRCSFNSAEPCNEWKADRGREAMRHASVANEEDFEHGVAKDRVWQM